MPLSDNQKPEGEAKELSPTEALRQMQELLRAPEARKKFVKALTAPVSTTKKPSSWSSLTNAPYYRERFALELKMVADAMLAEYNEGKFEDREYRYSQFCEGSAGISKNTLYLKINQSKLYLLEPENGLDPDGMYKRFFELITITRERTGIRLSYNKDVRGGSSMLPEKVMELKEQTITWKTKVDEFLDNAMPGEVFELKRLSLTDEEQQTIKNSLVQLVDILYTVTDSCIKIRKISAEEAAKLNE